MCVYVCVSGVCVCVCARSHVGVFASVMLLQVIVFACVQLCVGGVVYVPRANMAAVSIAQRVVVCLCQDETGRSDMRQDRACHACAIL